MFDKFSERHIGVSNEKDLKAMLEVIGAKSVDELISQVIPQSIRLKKPLALPAEGMREYEFAAHIRSLADRNRCLRSFIGMGYYRAAPPLPPLVEAAIEDIRQNYAGLYGVEELSERLGVSKSHLVRTFTAAVGVPPGRYLTTVRVEAAMRLLLHREYTLDVIASLCGFSGANYLCRVFKKETGQSPAQWRALAGQTARPLSPAESQREQALYI